MAYHGIGPWSKSAQNALSDTKRSVFVYYLSQVCQDSLRFAGPGSGTQGAERQMVRMSEEVTMADCLMDDGRIWKIYEDI